MTLQKNIQNLSVQFMQKIESRVYEMSFARFWVNFIFVEYTISRKISNWRKNMISSMKTGKIFYRNSDFRNQFNRMHVTNLKAFCGMMNNRV